jgi:beta-lactamase regulating signal transducer with metallopeptidase domain
MNIDLHFAQAFDLLLKSGALLALGAGLLLTWRKRSAANRHAISVAIFAALLLLPLTTLISPIWSFTLKEKADPAVSVRLPFPGTSQTSPGQADPLSAEPASRSAVSPSVEIPWKWLALSVWLGGVLLLLARRGLIVLKLRTVVRRSEAIRDGRLRAIIEDLVKKSGVRAEVRESALCRVPIVAGIVRPVVLLPLEAKDWNDGLIASALRHELGHIRRRDCVTRLLADIVRAFYWLNPLVWFAARQMRLVQEQACDDLVLNSGAPAGEYAGQLVEVVRHLGGDRFTAHHALAMAQPSTLETRVLAIVDATRDRSPRSVRGTFAGFAFVATALALGTAAQLRAADPEKPVALASAAPDDDAPDTSNASNAPQIMIEVKFIEFSGKVEELPELLQQAVGVEKPGVAGVVGKKEADEVLKKLSGVAGVDLLSTPRVVAFSKQQAKIEMAREFRYATEWDKDAKSGAWKPITFDTKNLGVTFEVTPVMNDDGTVVLHMIPQVNEFEGFVDLDAKPANASAEPGTARPIAAGADGKGIPEGHRGEAVFNIRRMDTTATVKPGDTVVLGGVEHEDVQVVEDKVPLLGDLPLVGQRFKSSTEHRITRRLIVLVTAHIVETAAKPRSLEILSDSTNFDKKTGTFTASGNVEIKTVDAVIRADAVQVTPKKATAPDAASPNGVNADSEWILPKAEFRDATLQECVAFLVAKSKELDPAGEGVNIVLKGVDKIGDAKITLRLINVPLPEALRYVTSLAGCEMIKDGLSYIIQPLGSAAGEAPGKSANAPAPAPPMPGGAAFEKAATIILPKIELQEATLTDTITFLRQKAKDLDADKQGVNLILEPATADREPRISLSLTNIPLSEALRYVAQLAGCEIVADDNAITLRPTAK